MSPFLQGRKIAATAALAAPQVSAPMRLPGMVRPAPLHEPGPSVEAVKEGDKVIRLIVRCACGEKLEIECLYSA